MFIYKNWDKFCKKISELEVVTMSVEETLKKNKLGKIVVLKHDVETNPKNALKLAKIESKYNLKGSYYVQAYLIKNLKNIKILKEIQKLGHEVSYHHDVMDSNKGQIEEAKEEFEKNVKLFEKNGFKVVTVCQHGNPIVKREGYCSNRDFFRNSDIAEEYNHITEVMVSLKKRIERNYEYVSDAGYGWKNIFDPENNDRVDSSIKDIKIESFEKLISFIKNTPEMVIISTHPHRWSNLSIILKLRKIFFSGIKKIVKKLMKINIFKAFFEKFYFLAKKI